MRLCLPAVLSKRRPSKIPDQGYQAFHGIEWTPSCVSGGSRLNSSSPLSFGKRRPRLFAFRAPYLPDRHGASQPHVVASRLCLSATASCLPPESPWEELHRCLLRQRVLHTLEPDEGVSVSRVRRAAHRALARCDHRRWERDHGFGAHGTPARCRRDDRLPPCPEQMPARGEEIHHAEKRA